MIVDGQQPETIAQAAQALKSGALLGLPTETVYGLAADAGNDAAVLQIFKTKGRPANHPLIVHVATAQGVSRFASHVPAFAQKLIDAFWPGPLTLILPRRSDMAAVAAGGQDSVGLRCPSHPVAQAVLLAAEALGVYGVAAPSANLFGRVSPTTAAHVAQEFDDALLIVDGGSCEVGIESTIVDCTRVAPVLLRPGVLTPKQLSDACGVTVLTPKQSDSLPTNAPRASGTLEAHYAPHARVRLMTSEELEQALQKEAKQHDESIAVWSRSKVQVPEAAKHLVQCHVMPSQPEACAHVLFAQLRAFDALGVKHIWVEAPPFFAAWDGVRDRLMRAAASET